MVVIAFVLHILHTYIIASTDLFYGILKITSNSHIETLTGKRRYNIKLWKTFTDCFNCLPVAAIIDEKILTMHGGLSPDLQSMEQIRRVMRPTDVPDTGIFALVRVFAKNNSYAQIRTPL